MGLPVSSSTESNTPPPPPSPLSPGAAAGESPGPAWPVPRWKQPAPPGEQRPVAGRGRGSASSFKPRLRPQLPQAIYQPYKTKATALMQDFIMGFKTGGTPPHTPSPLLTPPLHPHPHTSKIRRKKREEKKWVRTVQTRDEPTQEPV